MKWDFFNVFYYINDKLEFKTSYSIFSLRQDTF